MMRGLYSGVSGLQSHQLKMDVIGDNIANINTVGFKKNEVIFNDFMSELYSIAHGPDGDKGGTGPSQVGLGVQVGSMTRDNSQGAMNRTDRKLDVAVQGDGYFVIGDGDANYFTRNGHFELDSEGTLVYAPGLKVQGWQAAADPVTGELRVSSSTTPIGDIQIKMGDVIPAKATTTLSFNGNLNSENSKAIDPITVEWSAGPSTNPIASKININFEHCHPTLPYYTWSATWAENPPAGFEVGDAVLDANTERAATGIIQLNDAGKVVGDFINTNIPGVVNASTPVSSSTNGAGNIGLAKVEARNQSGVNDCLWKVVFEQNSSGTFDKYKYNLYASTDNGVTWSKDDITIKDANNNSATTGDIRSNMVFTYTVNAPNDRKMYGQLTLLASDWTGEASNGDVITFKTADSDYTADWNSVVNLPTEKPKEEDDWQAMVATKPIADGDNDTDSGKLQSVNVQRSVKIYLNSSPSSSIDSSGGLTGAVTTASASSACLNFGTANPTTTAHVAVDGFVAPGETFRIKLHDNYNGTTEKTFYLMDASSQKVIAQGNVGSDFNQYGVYIPAGAWNTTKIAALNNSGAGAYLDFQTTTIDPGPRNYRVQFTNSTTYNLDVYNSTTDTWKTMISGQSKNDDLDLEKMITTGTASACTANINDDTIKIPWSNWSGTFQANDTFYFATHKAVSDESGHRDFFRVKDTQGNLTEIFVPSGSLTGADPITFTPNTTETSTAQDTAFVDASTDANLSDFNIGTIDMGIAVGGSPVTATVNNRDEYQYVTNVDVYDSLGKAHNVPITFERKGTNLWMWSISDPTPEDPNNVELAGYGLLAFKADGTYDAANSVTFNSEVGLQTPQPLGPVNFQGIYFDPSDWGGAPVPPEGASPTMITPDFSELVQYASTTDGEVFDQDGYAKGTLTDYAINEFGIITGLYDNGHAQDIAQIALSSFNNQGGLLKMGNSLYRTTSNSGHARVGVAGTAGRGTMASGNLESSNVDMGREFTEMITTQRGFQANSRIISTEDQMLQELLALKR